MPTEQTPLVYRGILCTLCTGMPTEETLLVYRDILCILCTGIPSSLP